MDECTRDEASSCENGPGRPSGDGVGGLEMAGAVEFGTSSCIGASVSKIDGESLGMTMAPSGRLLKIRLTAIMPAAPVKALKSAPT